jgi:nucleotide-binding universal stress UspA family protein
VAPAPEPSGPRGMFSGPFRRVLVGWDGSPGAVAALRMAAAIVGAGPGHVVALAVQAGPPHLEAEADQGGEMPASMRRAAETYELIRASIAPVPPVRISLHTAAGRQVAPSLCNYAAEHGFDLLVLGRHGEGGILHPRLGHVAEAAARASQIPVLLLSAP